MRLAIQVPAVIDLLSKFSTSGSREDLKQRGGIQREEHLVHWRLLKLCLVICDEVQAEIKVKHSMNIKERVSP